MVAVATLWRRACSLFSNPDNTLHQPLGKWRTHGNQPTRRWPAYHNIRYPFLSVRENNKWIQYEKSSDGSYHNPCYRPQWLPTADDLPCQPIQYSTQQKNIPAWDDAPLPSPCPTIPETFEELVQTLPAWKRKLIKGTTLLLDPYALLDHLDTFENDIDTPWRILVVSDGSKSRVTHNHGSLSSQHQMRRHQ